MRRLMETAGVSVDSTASDNHVSDDQNSSNPSSPTTMRRSSSPRTTSSTPFPIVRFLQAPVTTLIEYSGVLRPRSNNDHHESESESLISSNRRYDRSSSGGSGTASSRSSNGDNGSSEVSIRIMSGGDQEEERGEPTPVNRGNGGGEREVAGSGDHLQGLFVTIYITAFMYKSNDILRKQTALKAEKKLSVLVGYCIVFMLHVIGVYWWYQNDDLCNPLFMVPPKAIPPFWNAIFTIIVNDTMVRQAAMAFKLVLLMYYKNGRGHSFRRQGQMLTLVEYTLLLYRAFLPAPVWYRFFLNKEYGGLFSSLTTGLYLTLKLTSVVEKIGSFYAALKALSRKEVNYGSHATAEQVSEAGDLCAICQEKMEAPILLRCKHIFCEDCVSEWFERERTCPLCRALVRPADIRSFGDGSTSLFFQLF
ncbi:hypothetical protein L1987_24918 [Smallanthus sonchifolius]|uniref:Uncharacterized protein n=1 Tax=Smallanthus sonchifolius TaxID=185202 RepID=A0ACB9INJ7_9ASTR|nr:hypothetical protein L1987_24918 [Smallanthus sonchifolius]